MSILCGGAQEVLTRVWSDSDINQGQTGGAHTAGQFRAGLELNQNQFSIKKLYYLFAFDKV